MHPTAEHIEWLTSRPWYKPIHNQINAKLQSIMPNTHIVAMPSVHIPLESLLDTGRLYDNKVVFIKMKQSQCHNNCNNLLENGIINIICTGYALSDDGLWRFHSWGLTPNGTLVETSTPRLMYFGVEV